MFRAQELDNQLIRDSFREYLVSTPPLKIQFIEHPLFSQHAFKCFLGNKSCIGYYNILNSGNYFPKLQELLTLKGINKTGLFVQFLGIWLEQQKDQSIVLYVIFEKLENSIKELLLKIPFNEDLFWQYLTNISQGMIYLQQKNLLHGNLNYFSLLTKQNKSKLFYFPSIKTSLSTWNKTQDIDYLFFSPQEINAHNSNSVYKNYFISDVFNLGAILITILLSNHHNVYGNQNMLERKLEQIEKKYGFNMYFIMEKMTRLSIKQRIQWFQIEPYINELYEKRNIKQKISNQSKIIDFTQGAFKQFKDNQKVLPNSIYPQEIGSDNNRIKRRAIFDKASKRNLLQDQENPLPNRKKQKNQVEPNQQCIMAHCYLRI